MKIILILLAAALIAIAAISYNGPAAGQNDLSHFYEDKDYVEGEIIVMFKTAVNEAAFISNYEDINLDVKEVLVPEMNIYLISLI